ncbi:MAG: hypothetical protein GY708_07325 [Actinomycetia bacterium]|nr:hypothetical protein [Actinomycetes bacterium]
MITIESSFNGPDGLGHGGTSAGRFAQLVNSRAASVRLHEPVPLDAPMSSATDPEKSVISWGERTIATVKPLARPLDVGQFGRLDPSEVVRAERGWLDQRLGEHMAPSCFACGHERGDHLGLGLRPGSVDGSALYACSWRPQIDGDVPDWLVWAALDCPSGIPALNRVDHDEAVVTGQLSVEIRNAVSGAGDYQLVSRRCGVEGRKHSTEAALIDERGVSIAVAKALWFTVPLSMTRHDVPVVSAAA